MDKDAFLGFLYRTLRDNQICIEGQCEHGIPSDLYADSCHTPATLIVELCGSFDLETIAGALLEVMGKDKDGDGTVDMRVR